MSLISDRIKELEGHTIVQASISKISDEFDDEPYLYLKMSDGTLFKIESNYGEYSGNSKDEYPRFISVKKELTEGVE